MRPPKPTGTGFKTVKAKKYQKKAMKKENVIETFNKFDILEEEMCIVTEVNNVKSNNKKSKKRIKILRKKHFKTDEIDASNFKKALNRFQKHLTTQNRFQIFEDNKEESLNRIIWRFDILQTDRKKIKKCHKCNFKKRTCILDPSSCQASQRCCYYCKKKGHFPSSACCKARRKSRSKQNNKTKVQPKNKSQKNISMEMIRLVKNRIQELSKLEKSKQKPPQIIDRSMDQNQSETDQQQKT